MCAHSYFIIYNLGFQSESGIGAQKGTNVHKTLEIISRLKKYVQDNPLSNELIVNDDLIGDFKISKQDLFVDSFVENLSNKVFDTYASRSKHKWTKADKVGCLDSVFKELRYNGGQFDPRLRKIIQAEPHFDISIDEEWAKFDTVSLEGETIHNVFSIKGTIDLVTEVSEDVIEVIDFKNGKMFNWAQEKPKTYETLKEDPQLLLYNYAISKIYPKYKQSIMSIFYINHGGPFSICFDESDNKKFLKTLEKKFNEIKNTQKPRMLSSSRSSWKCQKLCHFFKTKWEGTDKSICQHVQETLNKDGMEKTLVQLTKPGFSPSFYASPGA